ILGFGVVVLAVAAFRGAPVPVAGQGERVGRDESGRDESGRDESGRDAEAGRDEARPYGGIGRGALHRARWAARSPFLAVGATLGLVIAGYLGLQVYQATVFPVEYRRGDEI